MNVLSFNQLAILWFIRYYTETYGSFRWRDLYRWDKQKKQYVVDMLIPQHFWALSKNPPTYTTKKKLVNLGLIEWQKDRKPVKLTARGYALLEKLDKGVPEGQPWWKHYPMVYDENGKSFYWRQDNE